MLYSQSKQTDTNEIADINIEADTDRQCINYAYAYNAINSDVILDLNIKAPFDVCQSASLT